MKIYGNLICQNAMPDIVRCVESVAPLVEDYYIVDGGSTDGTWEWLNKWKDVYGLKVYQRKYDDQGKQRNFLLKKTPKDAWIINIDQDEELNTFSKMEITDFINRVHPDLYVDKKRELVLNININCINLVKDLYHYDTGKLSTFATKIFYNDRNLHFTDGYHTTICYDDSKRNYANSIQSPTSWCIRHYAYLDKDRIKNSYKDKKRVYRKDEFDEKNWKTGVLPAAWMY